MQRLVFLALKHAVNLPLTLKIVVSYVIKESARLRKKELAKNQHTCYIVVGCRNLRLNLFSLLKCFAENLVSCVCQVTCTNSRVAQIQTTNILNVRSPCSHQIARDTLTFFYKVFLQWQLDLSYSSKGSQHLKMMVVFLRCSTLFFNFRYITLTASQKQAVKQASRRKK